VAVGADETSGVIVAGEVGVELPDADGDVGETCGTVETGAGPLAQAAVRRATTATRTRCATSCAVRLRRAATLALRLLAGIDRLAL
jgi:hypothetical protein